MGDLFEWLSTSLTLDPLTGLLAAVAWGVVSVVLSPCHLATVPLAIAFLGKRSEGGGALSRPAGLSAVFALGTLASLLAVGAITVLSGRIAGDLWGVGPWLAAGLLLLAGLVMLDVVALPASWGLSQDRVPGGPRGAALLGASLGVTLGPCTFAFMAPVLAVAFDPTVGQGAALALMLAFGLGHTLAIGVAGLLGIRVGGWLRSTERVTRWGRASAGALLVLAGLYLVATAP